MPSPIFLHFHEHKNLWNNRFFTKNEGGATNRRMHCLFVCSFIWQSLTVRLIEMICFNDPQIFRMIFFKSNFFGQSWKIWKTIKESYKKVLFKDRTKRYVIRGDPEGKSRSSRCDLIKLKRVSNLHPLSSRSPYFENKIMS